MREQGHWNWQQPDWPCWRFDAGALAVYEAQFLLNAGQLAGALEHLAPSTANAVRLDVLSDEAIYTSRIEGEELDRLSVQSSIRRQMGLTAAEAASPAERGISELMHECFAHYDRPLGHQMLCDWQAMVCRGRSDVVVGGYRQHGASMQVVSGPLHQPRVHFEAPPSDCVADEMTRLIEWTLHTDTPALTRAGLVHLWFVSIHPFEDGNGRVGRALVEKILAQSIRRPTLVALSQQIERQRRDYYQVLEGSNKSMSVTPWLIWFAEVTLAAQAASLSMVRHSICKTRLMDRLGAVLNARQLKVMLRVFDAGPDGFVGGLSAKNYRALTGAPTATVTRDLADLVDKGALIRSGERRGTRYHLNLKSD